MVHVLDKTEYINIYWANDKNKYNKICIHVRYEIVW